MYCMLQEYSLVSSAGHPPIRPSTAGCLELFLGIPLVWNLGLNMIEHHIGRFFFLSWVKHMISICTAKNVLRFSRHQCVILNRSSLISLYILFMSHLKVTSIIIIYYLEWIYFTVGSLNHINVSSRCNTSIVSFLRSHLCFKLDNSPCFPATQFPAIASSNRVVDPLRLQQFRLQPSHRCRESFGARGHLMTWFWSDLQPESFVEVDDLKWLVVGRFFCQKKAYAIKKSS